MVVGTPYHTEPPPLLIIILRREKYQLLDSCVEMLASVVCVGQLSMQLTVKCAIFSLLDMYEYAS